jgi:hypothetical protein
MSKMGNNRSMMVEDSVNKLSLLRYARLSILSLTAHTSSLSTPRCLLMQSVVGSKGGGCAWAINKVVAAMRAA